MNSFGLDEASVIADKVIDLDKTVPNKDPNESIVKELHNIYKELHELNKNLRRIK